MYNTIERQEHYLVRVMLSWQARSISQLTSLSLLNEVSTDARNIDAALMGEVEKMAVQTRGYVVLPTTSPPSPESDLLKQPQPSRSSAHLIVKMANRGYDVVVDVDQEVRNHHPAF